MNSISIPFLLVVSLTVFSCSKSATEPDPVQPVATGGRPTTLAQYNLVTEGLKDYFPVGTFFAIGAAIAPSAIDNADASKLLKRHFSSLTAENVMKWSTLQPTEGNFNFTDADKIVAFAQANNMKVRGHTLCWHNQVPDWVFKNSGAAASKDLVLQRLRTHITTVMNHFKGKVYAWDVVNEAIDDGSNTYKATNWYNICGEDYITEAFKTARAADPAAKLFYNDYSEVSPTKRDKICGLLAKLKAQNLVDGMGMQCHWNINYPSDQLLKDALEKYKSQGVEIQVTELDVSVYSADTDPQTAYTSAIEQNQAVAYGRYFNIFRTYKGTITGVTFWGVADHNSWLNNFPVAGRKNYPLLFDAQYNPKQAYFTVINF